MQALAVSETASAKPWQFKPGQSGNPAGRQKGSRNKLANDFVADFYAAWQANGANALNRMAENDPSGFVNAAIKLMPAKLEVDINTHAGLSDDQFDALVEHAQAEIAKAAALHQLPDIGSTASISQPKSLITLEVASPAQTGSVCETCGSIDNPGCSTVGCPDEPLDNSLPDTPPTTPKRA